ncbi:MAG TPA: MgtC/SapB family protein [Candidatus Acidoferrum sp.]|nr:MgtC/SapB family protein [Candidatus Acidoferrum sp.]
MRRAAIRLFVALLLGALIGAERQQRLRMAGLRTKALVASGAAMFVMMDGLIAGDGSQGRVAAYVVSGIGFLGGGVILKDGMMIRGLNTAATLWFPAAIGTSPDWALRTPAWLELRESSPPTSCCGPWERPSIGTPRSPTLKLPTFSASPLA